MDVDQPFMSEMDEMMVQDAGIVPDEHGGEVVLEEESTSSQFNISLPNAANNVDAGTPLEQIEEPRSAEIPTPRRGGGAAKKKASPARAKTASARRGRSAGTTSMKTEEKEAEVKDNPQHESSEEIQQPAPVKVTVEESAVTVQPKRSSGRNARKKVDPDYYYEEPLPLPTTGRKARGSGTGGGGGSGASSLVSTSSSTTSSSKANDLQSNDDTLVAAVSVVLPDSTGASSETVVVDSYTYPATGSPAVTLSTGPDDEAKETDEPSSVSTQLADDVIARPLLMDVGTPVFSKPVTSTGRPVRRRASKSETGHSSDGPKLYCICKKPYDKRFMISCDTCEEWFHGTCVGVTKKQGEKITREKIKWICPPCRAAGTPDEEDTIASIGADISTSSSAPTTTETTEATAGKEEKIVATKEDPDFLATPEKGKAKKIKKKITPKSAGKSEATVAEVSPSKSGSGRKNSMEQRPSTSSPRKMSDAREKARERLDSASRLHKESAKAKSAPKVEEKPPVEADSSGLVLTALGKPAAAGSRSLRTTHLSRPSRPPVKRADNLFDTPKTTPPVRPSNPLPVPHKTESPKPVHVRPPTAPKLKPCICMVCKKVPGRENALYCSTECVMRHANDALELVKSTVGTPNDRIAVMDKQTNHEMTGNEAPLRTTLRAFLEAHQTCCVNIPSHLMQARASQPGVDLLDPVRASTRLMLKDHLLNRWKEAPDLQKDYPESMLTVIATKIETGLFRKFKDTSPDYKKKYRAIVLNITERSNENFYRRLITQTIPPGEVADLSPEQMASDSMAQWRQEVERKELDLIIQTQLEEQQEARPVIKKTHRGDEFLEDEIVEEIEARPELQPNVNTRHLTDPAAGDNASPRDNFSPAIILSPSDATKSPAYSFSSTPKISPGGTISSSQNSFRTASPEHHYTPSPGRLTDLADEQLKNDHKTHIFEISCKYCTAFSTVASPSPIGGVSNGGSQGESISTYQSPKNEPIPRRIATEGSPTVYSSPTGTGFKVPAGGMAAGLDRKRKIARVDEDADSPVSSTSDNSPRSEDAMPDGVIWQGSVDTKDLPAARLQAFTLYGKAAEFMAKLPDRLDQLGRIQPAQLWPYLEQVKPLKDIAVVVLKNPPGRITSEFNSLHYFLTTRGRVSVLGPLPATFKDFYMIALKENEPIPESLALPDGAEFSAEHGKVFLGIIVHHRARPAAPASIGRGMFEVPTTASLIASRKLSPYPSPENPSTPSDSITTNVPTLSPRTTRQSHDPIVSRFLEMEGLPIAAPPITPTKAPPAVTASPDTSEPMDIDDDTPKQPEPPVKPPEAAKILESTKPADVNVSDLLKLVKTLPSKTQAALGLAPAAGAAKSAPPIDPRRNRFQASPLAESEPVKTHAIQINLAMTKAPLAEPVPVVTVPVVPAETATSSTGPSGDPDSETGYFSKKFIENLAKIEFPEGLKEALRSIQPQTGVAPSAQPETARPSLLGLPPNYSVPPPNLPSVRPNFHTPPPNLLPGYQPPRFQTRLPGPGYHEPHSAFGDRGPPPGARGNFPGGPPTDQRWRGPPPSDLSSSQRPPAPFSSPQQYSEFRPRGPPGEVAAHWGDRPGGLDRARPRSSPPPPSRDRNDRNRDDRRESDRDRPSFPARNRRSPDRESPRTRRVSPRRRIRSRSRSPPGRRGNRDGDRDRRRRTRSRSRDRSGGRRRDPEGPAMTGGVDEFGRDIGLRRQVSKSESRDRELSTEKSGSGERRGSNEEKTNRKSTTRVSLDRLSDDGEKTNEEVAKTVELSTDEPAGLETAVDGSQ